MATAASPARASAAPWRERWGVFADLIGKEFVSTGRIETDGALPPEYRRADMVDALAREVWGQGFAPPTFGEEVEVLSQRLLGEKHLALKLRHQGQPVDGIWFGRAEPLPPTRNPVKLAFRLEAEEWQGVRRLRFLVEGAEL